MDFPVEDVIRNARHFLTTVKKATGNLADKDDRHSKGGPKPGMCIRSTRYIDIHLGLSKLHYPSGVDFNARPGYPTIRCLSRGGPVFS